MSVLLDASVATAAGADGDLTSTQGWDDVIFIHSGVHACIHSFIHAFIHSVIHAFIHLFILGM